MFDRFFDRAAVKSSIALVFGGGGGQNACRTSRFASYLGLRHLSPVQLGLSEKFKFLAKIVRNSCTHILGSPTPKFCENCAGAPPHKFRIILVSVNVCPQFWGRKWLHQFYGRLEKMRLFCRKNHVREIPRFFWGGGGYFGFFGGGVSILFL